MASIIPSLTYKTEKTAGIVIPTALRHNIGPFLQKFEACLLEEKISPTFYIQATPVKDEKAIAQKILHYIAGAQIEFSSGGFGTRVHEGFDKASASNEIAIWTCDDFDHLLPSFSHFIQSIGQPNKMVLGKWDAHSISYLPYPMWLNEAGISAAVSYANPARHSKNAPMPGHDNLESFILASRQDGTWLQSYIGLFGMVSNVWKPMREKMYSLFSNAPNDLSSVGSEAGIVLAALANGVSVGLHEVPKRFEHSIDYAPGSEEEQNFSRSRHAQFESGHRMAVEFVRRTGQEEKIGPLDQFMTEMALQILNAPFAWPPGYSTIGEQWPLASEWNTPIQTTW